MQPTYVKFGDVLAESGVILLDEEPADLILGVVGGSRGLVGGLSRVVDSVGSREVVSGSSAVLLLVDAGSVCCHLV